jgi:hypothetical protein
LRTIEEQLPDIICFQEVLPHVADWLRENLTGFVTVGCGRNRFGMLDDEQVTIAFRSDKYSLVEMNTFWMSPTPYVPGSRFEEQSVCPRVVTEVLLFDRAAEQVVRVLNVHLDHRGAEARRLGLKHLGPAHFQTVRRDVGVQGHILALEGGHPKSVLMEDAAQCGAEQALPRIGGGALNHDGPRHGSTSLKAFSKAVFSSPVRTNVIS